MAKRPLIAMIAFSFVTPALAELPPMPYERPVMVGGNPDIDACSTVMKVTVKKTRPENFAAVRIGPSMNAGRSDKLPAGYQVIACETVGEWTGVIYQPREPGDDGASADCGVNTPIANRMRYAAPCNSGWIATRLLRAKAG